MGQVTNHLLGCLEKRRAFNQDLNTWDVSEFKQWKICLKMLLRLMVISIIGNVQKVKPFEKNV